MKNVTPKIEVMKVNMRSMSRALIIGNAEPVNVPIMICSFGMELIDFKGLRTRTTLRTTKSPPSSSELLVMNITSSKTAEKTTTKSNQFQWFAK
mmetsp:Transcript_1313/g.2370  ORF Transcript_1313/g.2370 Transcript_1313/m.2370 type:complete len:94 (+) Transcript_1313:4534-4815(+)